LISVCREPVFAKTEKNGKQTGIFCKCKMAGFLISFSQDYIGQLDRFIESIGLSLPGEINLTY